MPSCSYQLPVTVTPASDYSAALVQVQLSRSLLGTKARADGSDIIAADQSGNSLPYLIPTVQADPINVFVLLQNLTANTPYTFYIYYGCDKDVYVAVPGPLIKTDYTVVPKAPTLTTVKCQPDRVCCTITLGELTAVKYTYLDGYQVQPYTDLYDSWNWTDVQCQATWDFGAVVPTILFTGFVSVFPVSGYCVSYTATLSSSADGATFTRVLSKTYTSAACDAVITAVSNARYVRLDHSSTTDCMASPGRVYIMPVIGVNAPLLPSTSVSVGAESSGVFAVTPPQQTVYTGVSATVVSQAVRSRTVLTATGRVLGGYAQTGVRVGARQYTTVLSGRTVGSVLPSVVVPSELCTSPATAYILYVQYEDGTPVTGGKLYMFSSYPKYYTSADIHNGMAMLCSTVAPQSVQSASYIIVDGGLRTYIATISNLTKQPSISSDIYTATVTATTQLTRPYKFQIDLQKL
ncbi:MAG: hypothetical protein ACPL4I_10965 [Bacteroidota bacterium]